MFDDFERAISCPCGRGGNAAEVSSAGQVEIIACDDCQDENDAAIAAQSVARQPMTHADIARRYPRLLRAVQWKACLSLGEATSCIRDYKDGFEYSSEAVAHYGGSTAVIRDAIAWRHTIARLLKGY